MTISKEHIRHVVFVHAVNDGLMDEVLAKKIESYNVDTYRMILNRRIHDLENRSFPCATIFSVEFTNSSVRYLREIADDLEEILSK